MKNIIGRSSDNRHSAVVEDGQSHSKKLNRRRVEGDAPPPNIRVFVTTNFEAKKEGGHCR